MMLSVQRKKFEDVLLIENGEIKAVIRLGRVRENKASFWIEAKQEIRVLRREIFEELEDKKIDKTVLDKIDSVAKRIRQERKQNG